MVRHKPKFQISAAQPAFTIAELLAVVMIIALIGGLGGGIYVGTYRKMLVERVAYDFLLTAKYARILAIERQFPCEIHLDTANGGFFLSTSRLNEQTGRSEKVVVKNYYCRPVQFEGDVKFEGIQITPIAIEVLTNDENEQTILFWPNGTAQSAVIQIGNGKTHYTASICASTGRTTMYFGTADNVSDSTIDLDAER